LANEVPVEEILVKHVIIPEACMKEIIPVYSFLSNDELLQSCLGGTLKTIMRVSTGRFGGSFQKNPLADSIY